MSRYLCMVFDAHRNVIRAEPFEAATDRCAEDQGILLQLTTRGAVSHEVWSGARKVAAFYGERAAWSSRRREAAIAAEVPTEQPIVKQLARVSAGRSS